MVHRLSHESNWLVPLLSVCRVRVRPSRLRPCCCPKMRPGCCAAICRALPSLPPNRPCSCSLLRCCSQPVMCALLQRHYLTGLLGKAQPSLGKSKRLFHSRVAAIGTAQRHLAMTKVQLRTLAVLFRQQHQMVLRPVLKAVRGLSLSHSMVQSKTDVKQLQYRMT